MYDGKTKKTTGLRTAMTPEKRVALIHRVIMPDKDYPKEYAILVTDKRSIFIRQEKTRSSFVLRGELRYGTAFGHRRGTQDPRILRTIRV